MSNQENPMSAHEQWENEKKYQNSLLSEKADQKLETKESKTQNKDNKECK